MPIKELIEASTEKLIEAFDSSVTGYEKLMSLTHFKNIKDAMEYNYSKSKDTEWLVKVYSHSLPLDVYLSGSNDFLTLLNKQIVDFKQYNYLRFKKENLETTFSLLQSISTSDAVDMESVDLLAKQADSMIDNKDSFEYRLIRILCVALKLKLYTVSNAVSRFLSSQFKMVTEKFFIDSDIEN